MTNKLIEIDATIQSIQNHSNSMNSQIDKLCNTCQRISNEKIDKQAYIEGAKEIWDSIRSNEIQINEHYNHTLTIENFVEKYAPMLTLTQISEALHSCLDRKYKKKLNQYERPRYDELHRVILEDEGNPYIK